MSFKPRARDEAGTLLGRRRAKLVILAATLVLRALLTSIPLWHEAQAADPPTWNHRLEEVMEAPKYQTARWGVLIADLQSGQVLFERDADKLFAPASVTKLYSVAAALETFGTNYQFETPVYARGPVDKQGLVADGLILVASGDLTLGGRTDAAGQIAFKDNDHTYANGNEVAELTEPDPLAGLNELAHQIAARGVKRVRGDIVIDDRLFDSAESSGSGPSRVTPILINDNLVDLLITPTEAGALASIRSRPESTALQVDAQVSTVTRDQELNVTVTSAGGGKIVVRGQIPVGHRPLVRVVEVEDPASFARALFIEALRRADIAVEASPLAMNRPDLLPARVYDQMEQLALFRSPPFAEEARLILKVSHNLHASTLPLLLAAKRGKRTLPEGLQLERGLVADLGVDVDTISFAGGAGGTRADYTTPRATVQLLRGATRRAYFSSYKAALPILGVDGTLSHSVDERSTARGKASAKTGTLVFDNLFNGDSLLISKAMAGYVTTRRGRDLVFAIFLNHAHLARGADPATEGRALGELCEIIFEEL